MSPCQRSIAYLKAQGFALVTKVEHFNHFAHVRQDLFGGDILAISLAPPITMLVQVTTATNNADHVKKFRAKESTDLLKAAGWTLVVHSWRKLKTSKKWEPIITML